KKELDTILEKDSEAFCKLYKVEATGNWPEGKEAVEPTNILWLDHFLSEEEKEVNNRCLPKLMAYRNQRVRPLTDDKSLLGWNALMNQA
ncbi:hypothetical protein ACO1MT_15240, partial [Staphylococcus aureus]